MAGLKTNLFVGIELGNIPEFWAQQRSEMCIWRAAAEIHSAINYGLQFFSFPSISIISVKWKSWQKREWVKYLFLKFSLELHFCWLCNPGISKCYCSPLIAKGIVFLSYEVPHAWLYLLSFTGMEVCLKNRICKYRLGRREKNTNMSCSEKDLVK